MITIIEHGIYSERRVVCITRNPGRYEGLRNCESVRFTTLELDTLDLIPQGYKPFYVEFDDGFEVAEVREVSVSINHFKDENRSFGEHYVFAADESHALKIAVDRRRIEIEKGSE